MRGACLSGRSYWYSRLLAGIGKMVEKSQRRQFCSGLQKAREQGLLRHLDDCQLRELGLGPETSARRRVQDQRADAPIDDR
jgi:hypothetical protein